MYAAILLFLIFNFIIVGFLVFCLVYTILENRIKLLKRCGALESENKALASQYMRSVNRLEDYKKKMPLKAKYRLGEQVVCVIKNKVIKGIVRAVILYEKEIVEYQVEIINNKDKTISNTIQVLEGYVYPENTLNLGGVNDK